MIECLSCGTKVEEAPPLWNAIVLELDGDARRTVKVAHLAFCDAVRCEQVMQRLLKALGLRYARTRE